MSENKERVEVTTQADLDREVKAGHPVLVRSGFFSIGDTADVEARGSSHVEAWDSSRVEAWGSSYVLAGGNSHVVAGGNSHVVAGKLVSVHLFGDAAVQGGVVIRVDPPKDAAEWCERYGVAVADGVATLYKAVRGDYRSQHGVDYTPGTAPEAHDWDGGKDECGGGLHFSPHPAMAGVYDPEAERYVACSVALSDMRPARADDEFPDKIKARRVCGPIVEVDRYKQPK